MQIDTKKLNKYLMSESNSMEMKGFVHDCVYSMLNDTISNDINIKIAFLNDLGLLSNNNENYLDKNE